MTATIKKSAPLLEKDVELQLLLNELGEHQVALSLKQGEVDERIRLIQQSCTHPSFTEERSSKDSWDGINMLVSKICNECGLKQIRPNGSSYQVCENCWGPMKYEGREPGQGGGIHHYECEKCHHHHSHT